VLAARKGRLKADLFWAAERRAVEILLPQTGTSAVALNILRFVEMDSFATSIQMGSVMRPLLSAVMLCLVLAGCGASGPPQVSEIASPGESSPASAGAGSAAAQTALYAQQP
jgi:hypothetical protein